MLNRAPGVTRYFALLASDPIRAAAQTWTNGYSRSADVTTLGGAGTGMRELSARLSGQALPEINCGWRGIWSDCAAHIVRSASILRDPKLL